MNAERVWLLVLCLVMLAIVIIAALPSGI